MKLVIAKRLLFFVIAFGIVVGCDDSLNEIDIPAPGTINLLISIAEWEQDSLEAVMLNIEEIKLTGPSGEFKLLEFEDPQTYNLLDFQGTPGVMVTENVPSGQYSGYNIKMSMLVKGAKGKEHKVMLCHIPPGNPGNARNLNISACAVPAHTRNHSDYLGTCTEDENNRNKGYSYLKFEDGRIEMLFAESNDFSGSAAFEVFEGDVTDVVMTIDLAKSLTLQPKESEENEEGRGNFEQDDLDGKESEDQGCRRHVFNPEMTFEVLSREGTLKGTYLGSMTTNRTYKVHLYSAGLYNDAEANRNEPFPNALMSAELNNEGNFLFGEIRTGVYDLVVAEFFRDRFIRVVATREDVVLSSNATADVEIEQR